jgi:hypothetical protein
MRFRILFIAISLFFLNLCNLFAQDNIMQKIKEAQEKLCSGEFFYGDYYSYDLSHTRSDPDKAENSELYKAVNTSKKVFFISTCTEGRNVRLAIYSKPENDKFYFKVFEGTKDQNGIVTLDSGNIKLKHELIADPNKQFSGDINKMDISFFNDGIELIFVESFFEQSKIFKKLSSHNGSDRIEMIVPFVAPPEKLERDASQEDKDDYNEEMQEYEASLLELEKPLLERLEKAGYTYSFLFIKVDGKKMGEFTLEELKLQGVNLSGLEKFPQDLPLELLFIGLKEEKGHYQLDITSILKGGDKGKDIVEFQQTNYSKQVFLSLGDTPSGSKDNIMLFYEFCQFITDCKPSLFISRKATRNGIDIIDMGNSTSARSVWGDDTWTAYPCTHADLFKGNEGLNLNAKFIRSNSININHTEDENAAVVLLIKQKVGKIQKQYVKELLGKDLD